MNWISVDERLPGDYKDVLFYAINELETREIMVGHLEKGIWHHCCRFYVSVPMHNVKVTHWSELLPDPD